MKYRYIFWDLDGTIANTYEGISNCLRYALKPYQICLESEEEVRKFIGPPFRYSFPKYCGLDPKQTEEAIGRYRERYIPVGVYECELFPGVRETMEKFRAAGCVQVLTSSKPEAQCRQILEKFELADLFDEVTGASPDGKIDTKLEVLQEAFRRICQKEDCQKDQVILIGDTQYDVDGAKAAGIDCIGVTYGFGTREELFAHGVVDACRNLEEVYRYIRG